MAARSGGSLLRSFPMPRTSAPEAAFRHGVLTLTLPKKEMEAQSVKQGGGLNGPLQLLVVPHR